MGKGSLLLLLAVCLAVSAEATQQCMSLNQASTEVYKFKLTQVRLHDNRQATRTRDNTRLPPAEDLDRARALVSLSRQFPGLRVAPPSSHSRWRRR